MDKALLKDYEKETHSPFFDSLTGLFNHGLFQIFLDKEITKCGRYGDLFTLVFIDIDSFSLYNKQHGSAKGDKLLKEIAIIINKNIRKSDVATRYSGDVFALILAKTTAEKVFNVIERIRLSVEKLTDTSLTISGGMAFFPKDGANKESLIQRTEEALFQAKTGGRNKICYFEEKDRQIIEGKGRILVVDDEPKNVKLLEAILKYSNYDVIKAYSGKEALYLINKADIDLILLDIMMPEMDGYEVCQRLKGNERTRMIPIVMVTALDDVESKIRGIEAGSDDFITKPPNKAELIARVSSLVNVNALNKKLTSIENVLISMANVVEAKDPYTQGHISRVSSMAVKFGKRMGLSAKEVDALRLGGILHDIGKIGIPEEILNKPGKLDMEEFEKIKQHTEIGFNICLPLEKTLGDALDVIRHHHEKLDGTGYPDGIKGEDISILARIMGIVDIFDALTTDRPYHKAMSRENAFTILCQEANAGKLDKNIVDNFIEMMNEL
jgi:putative two-component system response regulator